MRGIIQYSSVRSSLTLIEGLIRISTKLALINYESRRTAPDHHEINNAGPS